jgi:hypothetical protein
MRDFRIVIILVSFVMISLLIQSFGFETPGYMEKQNVYEVNSFEGQMSIDADWLKPEWDDANLILINNYMGEIPEFNHKVQAKMMYSASIECLYLIFRIEDKYVRCQVDTINGPVWHDSCVEFFFAPDNNKPLQYFNLEMNCAGIPLMHYNFKPREDAFNLDQTDIGKVEIATSMPVIGNQEETGPITWTLECRIPISILRKYSPITNPGPGVTWRANFYKIAHMSSHPHYITWSTVISEKPDFHLPEYFGILKFK